MTLDECCDECARKGMRTKAVWDAPTVNGAWAFLCDCCRYRLPYALRKLATRLTAQVMR